MILVILPGEIYNDRSVHLRIFSVIVKNYRNGVSWWHCKGLLNLSDDAKKYQQAFLASLPVMNSISILGSDV